MFVSELTADQRQAALARRVARVQPLPPEVCQWLIGGTPIQLHERLSLVSAVTDRIAQANPFPHPYLTIGALAVSIPLYESGRDGLRSEMVEDCLDRLCFFLSMTHLGFILDEDWSEILEHSIQEHWEPEYVATEFLQINPSTWSRELAYASSEHPTRKDYLNDVACFESRESLWARNFRLAHQLLTCQESPDLEKICKEYGIDQNNPIWGLIQVAKTASKSDYRITVETDRPGFIKPRVASIESSLESPSEESLDADNSSLTLSGSKGAREQFHPLVEDFFESLEDNSLHETLEGELTRARNEGRALSLIVIDSLMPNSPAASRAKKKNAFSGHSFEIWMSSICQELTDAGYEKGSGRIFSMGTGELIIVQQGGDRVKMMPWLRTVLENCEHPNSGQESIKDNAADQKNSGLVAGLASVERPNKSFRSEALVQAAKRCLEAARRQGANSIKSIDVY